MIEKNLCLEDICQDARRFVKLELHKIAICVCAIIFRKKRESIVVWHPSIKMDENCVIKKKHTKKNGFLNNSSVCNQTSRDSNEETKRFKKN